MSRQRDVKLRFEDFPDRTLLRRFEGGAAYAASRDGRFYVLINEVATFDLLSDEDREGLSPLRVLEFDSEAERAEYLKRRRWLPGQDLIDLD